MYFIILMKTFRSIPYDLLTSYVEDPQKQAMLERRINQETLPQGSCSFYYSQP